MAADLAGLRADLAAESEVLFVLLEPLGPHGWTLPTPAAGWTIADQVSHLAYFDGTTTQSLRDPEQFRVDAGALMAGGDDFPDRIAAEQRTVDNSRLLSWFRSSRTRLLAAYGEVDPAARLPWYGPDMGVASSITARLMETWAHGQDIADALGVERVPTDRLRHIAHLGIRSLPYSYAVNHRALPTQPIHVVLVGPDGDEWTWGPEDAADVVRGTGLDFCLAVTQRRHLSDTGLVVTGPVASEWMSIAQAFAGAAGTGRAPLSATGGPR
jgi:uncharacterized protein (TIGR03084 family)